MTSRDEYKINYCTILEDECVNWDCSRCAVATSEKESSVREEKENEKKNYTCFDKPTKIRGVDAGYVNTENTIAKLDLKHLQSLQKNDIISKKKAPYNPILFGQYEPNLRKLRRWNNLGIPTQIFIKKDYPAAFVWGDIVYLIAPKIYN